MFNTIIIVFFLISLLLVVVSYLKYKFISSIDLLVVFSWFFVFYRPAAFGLCDINLNLYYWREDLYFYGSYLSALLTVLLQVGGLFPNRPLGLTVDTSKDKVNTSVLRCCAIMTTGVFLVMVAVYGTKIFPSNRGTGALSVSLPGLEVFFYLLTPLTFLLIFTGLFQMTVFKKKRAIAYVVYGIFILMLFSKRGRIIAPILMFAGVYLYNLKYISRKSLLSAVNPSTLFLLFFSVLILFYGKSIRFDQEGNFNFGGSNSESSGIICDSIKKGHQEFDLLWPAAMDHFLTEDVQIFDLPKALYGSLLLSHEVRLDSEYLSLTDKLMLKHNADTYRYLKYGVSPSLTQYYWIYLGPFCLLAFPLFGFFYRKFDFYCIKKFFTGSIIPTYMITQVGYLFLSPFDFRIKYVAFSLVFLIFVYFCSVIYSRRL